MSAKKKKQKSGWLEIDEDIFTLCNQNTETGTPKKSEEMRMQAVISDKNFVFQMMTRPQDKDVFMLNSTLNMTLLMNRSTMSMLDIKLLDPVVVFKHCYGKWSPTFAYNIWPSLNVPHGKVGFLKEQMNDNCSKLSDFCLLKKTETISAKKLQLIPLDCINEVTQVYKSDIFDFNERVSYLLRRRLVLKDQVLKISFLGKLFQFQVQDVESEPIVNKCTKKLNGNEVKAFSLTPSKLAKNLSDLSLQSPNESTLSDDLMQLIKTFSNVQLPPVYLISSSTEIQIEIVKEEEEEADDEDLITFESVGGMEDIKYQLEGLVIKPMKYFYQNIGKIKLSNAVLLHGPSGTGKSLLAEAVANECGAKIVHLHPTDISSRVKSEQDKRIKEVFEEAKSSSPCVLIIDDIDTICPNQDKKQSGKAMSSFIHQLDECKKDFNKINDRKKMFVIATTNQLEDVDPKLISSRRFTDIEISVPTMKQRLQILKKFIEIDKTDLDEEMLAEIARRSHGFVGGDIESMWKKAVYNAIQRSNEDQIRLNMKDLEVGLKSVHPSAIRDLLVRVPEVHWSDIGGNSEVKSKLKQMIELPLKKSDEFRKMGVEPPRGVLLYGPPGCSKTLTAKALATDSGLNFISIKGPELFSKFVGDSEAAVRRVFAKARSAAPSIIFFDELDALAGERGKTSGNGVADRVLTALLAEMDGVEQCSDVIVVAATNRPHMIDKALLRPGRIDRIIYIPLPDPFSRIEIFKIRLSKMNIADDVSILHLVDQTHNYSGAEICRLCHEAGIEAIEQGASRASSDHFKIALNRVKPQSCLSDVTEYQKFAKQFAYQ